MQDWFQLFDADGTCIIELIAYTSEGALADGRQRGYTDAVTARKLFTNGYGEEV